MQNIESQSGNIERMPLDEIVHRLERLERTENNGRGISCVRTIIMYLRKNELERARSTAFSESDKIDGIVREFIIRELFRDIDEHPWSLLERAQKESGVRLIDGIRRHRIYTGYTIGEYFSHSPPEKGSGPGWDIRMSLPPKLSLNPFATETLPNEPHYRWEPIDEEGAN